MKSVPYIAAIAIVGLFAADTALAQQGPGRGAGFGRFMSPEASAEVICDVLLLDEERAEKVKAAYLEAMEGQGGAFGGMQGFQDMTPEERREAMQAIRERQADTVTEALKEKELVDEDESKAVHNVVASSRFVVIPEVRALRLIGIETEQRDDLLSSVIEVVEARPVIGFGGAGRGGQGGGEAAREAQEKLEALNAKIATVLNADQVEAWKEKTQEIEEEQARLLEEMRQRGPGGAGGGGGQRGGGGRQG